MMVGLNRRQSEKILLFSRENGSHFDCETLPKMIFSPRSLVYYFTVFVHFTPMWPVYLLD